MASSSIGMKPVPYQELPVSTDGSDMLTGYLDREPDFHHDTFLISGVRTATDVMRGEETQLIGILAGIPVTETEKLLIFPGTHSKHITVKGTRAVDFKTYMTGEFFDLLAKKSILHAGLEEGDGLHQAKASQSFRDAVIEGSGSNLLNACFRVRTNSLFDTLTKKENYYYLSGLLIGAELGEIAHNDAIEIYLSCGTSLKAYYETALEVLGLSQHLHSFPAEAVEQAAMIGQYKIFEKHSKR
jgi:2-dehydro-3-deoxygalactonokinase